MKLDERDLDMARENVEQIVGGYRIMVLVLRTVVLLGEFPGATDQVRNLGDLARRALDDCRKGLGPELAAALHDEAWPR